MAPPGAGAPQHEGPGADEQLVARPDAHVHDQGQPSAGLPVCTAPPGAGASHREVLDKHMHRQDHRRLVRSAI